VQAKRYISTQNSICFAGRMVIGLAARFAQYL
jgi:hypothetical protein